MEKCYNDKKNTSNDLERCLFVIRESFSTVAKEFNLTKDNCPNHTSFIDIQRLEYHWNNGFLMFGYYIKNNIFGYVSLSKKDDTEYELNNLAILPNYRHCRYGKELVAYCKDKVKALGGSKISIGIIYSVTKRFSINRTPKLIYVNF